MLLSSLLLVPANVHAATGTVSINGGAQVVATPSQTTVSVPVQISGSDALNGFDIQVLADPTVLKVASVDLTGSVIPSPTIVIECIDGVLVAGTTCAPQDGSGVVHLGAVHIGSLVAAPVTGLLFTINYNIVGTTTGTPISFNTGCSGTSVAGDCVTISNGTSTAVPEFDQGTTFANLNDFSMTADFAKISSAPGVGISENINYAALGAFSDSLNEIVTGPCTLASGSVDLTFPTGSDTLTCMSATTGDFPVTVTATGFNTGTTHSVNIDFLVAPAGFSSSLNQASVTVPRGFSDSSTVVTLTGVSGFSGTVAVSASGPSGITGTASPSMVTLTPDASGYSSATTSLTVSVGASVATGSYTLTITGGAVLTVIVPGSDFSLNISPDNEQVPRGSSAAVTVSLSSLGAFSGTVTLTATITPLAIDSNGVNNIVPGFLPSTVTLTAGGSGSTAFFASTVKIGTSPNPGNTATGNYSATITATAGSIVHTAVLFFQVQDFSYGPNFCAGNTEAIGSPNGEWPVAMIGESCNTFTLTTQTEANGGGQSELWVQVNSLGGLQTNGASFTPGIQAGDLLGPGRGRFVPEIGFRVCFFQTFFANGTQLTPTYIEHNGPVVRGDPTDGCRGDGESFPNDVAGTGANNADWLAVTADALSNTLPGTYLVNVCGEIGTLANCEMVTLIVIQPPVVHQFVYNHKVSLAAGGTQSFKLGVSNPNSQTVWASVIVTGTGSFGDTFTVNTGVFKINGLANANNLALSVSVTPAEIGETFTFSSSIFVSAVDPGAVIVPPPAENQNFGQPFPYVTSCGLSTLQSITATFTVTA